MTKAKFLIAAALLSAAMLVPGMADARHNRHHHHLRNWGLPYPISFLHNYGPGPLPATFAHYDGPPRSCATRVRPPTSARIVGGIPATNSAAGPARPSLIIDLSRARSSAG